MRPPSRPRATSRPDRPGPAPGGARTGAVPRVTPEGDRREPDAEAPAGRPARAGAARQHSSAAGSPRGDASRAARASGRAATDDERLATGPVPEVPARGAIVPAGEPTPPRVSTAMADRLAERTAMRRHRAWRRVVAWVVVVLVLAAVAAGAFWSPVLALDADEVVVTGQGSTVDPEEVRDVVEAADGTPLPRLDTVAMREQILGLHGVKDVSLARSWPHGLRVTLTARVPVAAVPDGGKYVVLDGEGVRLGTRGSAPSGLPQVDVPLDDARALQAALHVLAGLPPKLAGATEQVSAATQDAVETVLADGTTVRWGSSADLPLKVEAVRTLRKVAPDAGTIDVSSPELPITR